MHTSEVDGDLLGTRSRSPVEFFVLCLMNPTYLTNRWQNPPQID